MGKNELVKNLVRREVLPEEAGPMRMTFIERRGAIIWREIEVQEIEQRVCMEPMAVTEEDWSVEEL